MRTWIEKQKYLIDYTLSALARRKAKNLGLLLIYTAIVFLLASVMLFTHALRREAAHLLARSPDVIVQRMLAGRHDLIPASYLDKIGNLRGVQKREGRLMGLLLRSLAQSQLHDHGASGRRGSTRAESRSARRWREDSDSGLTTLCRSRATPGSRFPSS